MRVHLPAESRLLLLVALLLGILLSLGGPALATPVINLETEADWDAALGTTIFPVEDPYPALDYHYGTEYPDYIQVVPELYAYEDSETGLGDGLVMAWGDDTQDVPQVASWEYVYPVDPDLTGLTLKLSVNAPSVPALPPSILSVSLTLNDLAGGWASWAWNVGPAGPILPNTPYTVVIDPTNVGPQSGSSSFWASGVAGLAGPVFDEKITTTIVADELAVGPGGGPAFWATFPPVPVTGGAKAWNYWTGLQVQQIPEPSSIVLWSVIALAFGGIGWYRRRKS